MKKFLIIDTYNGEGYSDSGVEVREFESILDAKLYAFELAEEISCLNGSIEFVGNAFTYGSNYDKDEDEFEDQGAIHFVELQTDMYSITINPTVNEFMIHKEDEDVEVRERLLDSEESQDGEDLEGTCHHMDDSVEIYFKIKNL
jgi:hypothetical protein